MELFANLAADHARLEAKIDSVREYVARIHAESAGVSPACVLEEMLEEERKAHHRLLVEFEKKSPSLAALLDKREIEDVPDGDS